MEDPTPDGGGLITLTWEEFGRTVREFAEDIRAQFQPELVVGIARGGVIVGAVLASALQVDFFPIKISRRVMLEVVSEEPLLLIKPYRYAAGKRVLLVDDVSRSGETMRIAQRALERFGPAEVRTAAYADYPGDGYEPDFFKLQLEAPLAFPWDYHLLEKKE